MTARASTTAARSPSRERATRPDAAALARQQSASAARGSSTVDALVRRRDRGQVARDAAAGGASRRRGRSAGASARPRARARGCPRGRRRTARRAACRSRTLSGESSQSTRTALVARGVAARGERVLRVQLGRVVVGERGGDPALRPEARRLGERRAAHERDARALAGGDQRGVEPGGAGAHDCDVGADGLGSTAPRVPYRRRVPALLRHPSSLEHDTGPGHPERADRIRGDRGASSSARDGSAGRAARRPRATEEQLLRVHPPEYVERVRETERARRRLRPRHAHQPGLVRGGAARRRRGLRARRGAAAAAASAPASRRCGRPATTRSRARAMGFCLFATVAIAARHALDALGAERVLVLDWDVHHGNGTNTIFHESPEVLFASIHQYPFWPGTGPLGDVGAGDGRGLLVQPARARRHRRGRRSCRSSSTWWRPPRAQYRPDLILISAGYDAHRDDPLGGLRARDVVLRRARAPGARARGGARAPVGAVLEGATTSTRSPTRSRRRWRRWPETASRRSAVERHPLADEAAAGARPLLASLNQLRVGARVAVLEPGGLAGGALAGVEAAGVDDPQPAARGCRGRSGTGPPPGRSWCARGRRCARPDRRSSVTSTTVWARRPAGQPGSPPAVVGMVSVAVVVAARLGHRFGRLRLGRRPLGWEGRARG